MGLNNHLVILHLLYILLYCVLLDQPEEVRAENPKILKLKYYIKRILYLTHHANACRDIICI